MTFGRSDSEFWAMTYAQLALLAAAHDPRRAARPAVETPSGGVLDLAMFEALRAG
ncbi:MAG: hypothetical protein IPM45_18045 [Acidimicrobiales bacterium]|nr:hypothetical protein [Acidimicrobiales bacterium]